MTLALLDCARTPPLEEYPPLVQLPFNSQVARVPVIAVGVIKGSTFIGKPHKSRWHPWGLMQLIRVDVDVENVIEGDIKKGDASIYFYSDDKASGPPRLGMAGRGGTWRIGDREMFFLQNDTGYLRTVCDTYRSCVITVTTGPHPNFKTPRHLDFIEGIADILLTKGEHCTDAQMAQALHDNSEKVASFSRDVVAQYLERSLKDSDIIRLQASIELKNLKEYWAHWPYAE